jgi:transposase
VDLETTLRGAVLRAQGRAHEVDRLRHLDAVRGRRDALPREYALNTGGRAGVRLARVLGIPGSFRTMVRLVHGAPFPLVAVPRVIGLDEWAWRRGRRFGTMIRDLERHHVLDLLPERSASSVAQWLQAHPSVEIVCRDRSSLYAEGIRQGAPQAIQVVDRFHLVQNLRDALERFFLRRRRDLDTLGASLHQSSELTPTPAMMSQARNPRWIHRYHEIQRLRAQHLGIAAIARRVQVSRPTVYRYLAMPQPPERQRSRHRGQPLITPYTPYLRRRWNAGCRNAQQLWRELVAEGHRPSRRTVERYVGRLRRETGIRFKFRQAVPAPLYAEDHDESRPSALTTLRAARLFLSKEQDRRAANQTLLAHLLRLGPVMIDTYHHVQAFCRMVRHRRGDDGLGGHDEPPSHDQRRYEPAQRTGSGPGIHGLRATGTGADGQVSLASQRPKQPLQGPTASLRSCLSYSSDLRRGAERLFPRSVERDLTRMKSTDYFRAIRSRPDRAIIRDEWIGQVVENPEHERVQEDGRIQRWARIAEADDRYLRVVLLADGETVHNAFFDRGFRP